MDGVADNLGAILQVMDWLSRLDQRSKQRLHRQRRTVVNPSTRQTCTRQPVHDLEYSYQMLNAFNAYGIDHVVLVKLASAAVVCWLLGMTEVQAIATLSHVWMDPANQAGHFGLVEPTAQLFWPHRLLPTLSSSWYLRRIGSGSGLLARWDLYFHDHLDRGRYRMCCSKVCL
jgi:hypothetical protein